MWENTGAAKLTEVLPVQPAAVTFYHDAPGLRTWSPRHCGQRQSAKRAAGELLLTGASVNAAPASMVAPLSGGCAIRASSRAWVWSVQHDSGDRMKYG